MQTQTHVRASFFFWKQFLRQSNIISFNDALDNTADVYDEDADDNDDDSAGAAKDDEDDNDTNEGPVNDAADEDDDDDNDADDAGVGGGTSAAFCDLGMTSCDSTIS